MQRFFKLQLNFGHCVNRKARSPAPSIGTRSVQKKDAIVNGSRPRPESKVVFSDSFPLVFSYVLASQKPLRFYLRETLKPPRQLKPVSLCCYSKKTTTSVEYIRTRVQITTEYFSNNSTRNFYKRKSRLVQVVLHYRFIHSKHNVLIRSWVRQNFPKMAV